MRRANDPTPTRAGTPGRHRSPALLLAAALTTAVTGTACAQTQTAESPTKPSAREGAWMGMHESFLKRARQGKVDLLFLGDSITQGWDGLNDQGKGPREVWDRYYGPRHAANFGIGGDRTQHVLWRLDHGEVDGISPKVVVLMIGTNNIHADTPAEIAEGVKAVVEKLRSKLPQSRVLLLGVFPRSKTPDSTRDRVKAVNLRIARLDDGARVKYLDISRHFVEEDGSISREMMPDFLHLSRKGYRVWADAMEPTLWEMMEAR